jgi:ketosteroid isomerase-like protein
MRLALQHPSSEPPPRSPSNARGEFERASCAPASPSGAVAQLNHLECQAIPPFPMNHESKFAAGPMALALLATMLATGCASLRTGNQQIAPAREQEQIEQRLQEVFAAAESKDFDRLDSYHLYGPKFTKFTGSSPDRLDAAAGQAGEHDGLGATTGLKMRADAVKIDIFDNVGIATFILDYSFDVGGEAVQKKERTTLVFVRERGAWKIAHEHLSPISP